MFHNLNTYQLYHSLEFSNLFHRNFSSFSLEEMHAQGNHAEKRQKLLSFNFISKELINYTYLEPVVGPGRSPDDPATSKWEYFKGFSEESWCLVRPDTVCKKAPGN